MSRIVLELIGLYRVVRGALLPPSCRFIPSCSEYAEEAIIRYGVLKSLPLILSRLLRCHPFHPGGFDPVCRKAHGAGAVFRPGPGAPGPRPIAIRPGSGDTSFRGLGAARRPPPSCRIAV